MKPWFRFYQHQIHHLGYSELRGKKFESMLQLTMDKMLQNSIYTGLHNSWSHFLPNLFSILNQFEVLCRQLRAAIKALNGKLHWVLQRKLNKHILNQVFIYPLLIPLPPPTTFSGCHHNVFISHFCLFISIHFLTLNNKKGKKLVHK